MATPAVRSVGTFASGNGVSVSPGNPSGSTTGDLNVLLIDAKYSGSPPTFGVAGYTQLFSIQTGGNHSFEVWTAPGGTAAPTVTGASNSVSAQIICIQPSGGGTVSIDVSATSTSSGTVPSVDPTVADALLAIGVGNGVATGVSAYSLDGLTWTEQFDNGTTAGLDSGVAMATAAAADGDPTGTGTYTGGGTAMACTIAFKESTSAQTVALGMASETNTARALGVGRGVSLGRASETDTARALTPVSGNIVALGRASETNEARALAAITTQQVPLGRASETNTARSLTAFIPGSAVLLNLRRRVRSRVMGLP